MSRPNWRSRSVLAAGAAVVLVGTGVAALASTGGAADDDAPAATSSVGAQATGDDRSAELRRSVDDLLGQVDALEASLATPTPTPTPTPSATPAGVLDDHGGDRPAGVSDDGPDHDRYDDHGGRDDDGGDDRGEDRGDDRGDDHGDDHGGHGEDEGDDD